MDLVDVKIRSLSFASLFKTNFLMTTLTLFIGTIPIAKLKSLARGAFITGLGTFIETLRTFDLLIKKISVVRIRM
jgi:hypothetical protein